MISLCMIVKNEEDYLEHCIESVRTVVDEIIVVDTGSNDNTVEIARRLGAKVYSFPWNEDFSEARNHSLKLASGDWILVLDADEMLARRDAVKIRALAYGDGDGYLFTVRSYSCASEDIRWVANDGSYQEGDGWDGWISSRAVRMFRRKDHIRFEGVVHETVVSSMCSSGGTPATTDIVIHHFPEIKGKTILREKRLHYLRLCEKNLESFPNDAKTYFDMGLIYKYTLNDIPRAIMHQKQALQLDPSLEDARMVLAISHHNDGDSRSAAAEVTTLLRRNPGYAPALLLCGIMLERRGKLDRAIECYERALRLNPNLIDARINLGSLRLRKGNSARARSEWELVHRMNPSSARTLLNLGALELREGNYVSAQCFFERALEQSPDNALLWNNMGVLHTSLGRAREALEAFEKAVDLDPSCEDARRNLEVVRTQTALLV